MRFSILTGVFLLGFASGIAQLKSSERKFIYGTLKGGETYIGYFWFDHTLSQMGQRIVYKQNLADKKGKTFYALNFESFVSDSLFLRNFKTIPYGTGRLQAMIPRIVSGKLELYDASYRGAWAIDRTEHFYIYDGKEKIRLVRRKFKEQMKELLHDDEDILQRIEREEVTYDDIPTIIYNYNLRKQKDSVGARE